MGWMAGALTAVFALAFASPASSQERTVAGLYGPVPLAYDKSTGVVSGYFSEETGRGQFSCIFYFSGHLAGNTARILSYFPDSPADTIGGVLTLNGDGALEIRLSEDPGGCWNVEHFSDPDEPAIFTLDTPKPAWIAIDIVKSAKAYFYTAANGANRRSAYVVQGDAVAIVGKSGGWDRVEYVGEGKSTSGYLKRSDLYGVSELPVPARPKHR